MVGQVIGDVASLELVGQQLEAEQQQAEEQEFEGDAEQRGDRHLSPPAPRKSSRSPISRSLWLAKMPCAPSSYSMSLAVGTALATARPVRSIGTVASSTPWMTRVGMEKLARSA